MSAKVVCPDCQLAFEPPAGERSVHCPTCNAAIPSWPETPADEIPSIEPSRLPVARPVAVARKDRSRDDDEPRRRRWEEEDDRPRGGNGKQVAILVSVLGVGLLAVVGLVVALFMLIGRRDADLPPPELAVEAPRGAAVEVPPPVPQVPNAPLAFDPPQPPPRPFDPNVGRPVPPPKPPAERMSFPPVVPLPLTADHDLKERREIQLPGEATEACAAGGGRFVCFLINNLRQVAVFDTAAAKVVKYLPVTSENTTIAAGMDRLIVHDRTVNVFVRWNLRTFEKEATVPNPTTLSVQRLLLGSASTGPLILVPKLDENAFGRASDPAYLDPATLRVFAVEPPKGRPYSAWAALLSENGRLLVGPTGGHNGVFFAQIGGTVDVTTASIERMMLHYPRPSADGRYVYTANGVYSATGKAVAADNPTQSHITEPAVQGGLVVRVYPPDARFGPNGSAEAKADVKFYLDGQTAPFLTWSNRVVPLPDGGWRGGGVGGPERRYFLVPDAKLLVMLAMANNKLILERFDLGEELEKSGVDYLLVTSRPPPPVVGTAYTYPIRVKSKKGGVKFKLESGPDGMTVAADGKLTWAVPADAGPANVLLTVSDAAGQEVFHNFTLEPTTADAVAAAVAPRVNPGPPPAAVVPAPVAVSASPVVVPAKVFPLTPTTAADGAEVKLPGAAGAVCFAGGGRFVVLTVPTAKQIVVLDVCDGKVAKTLPAAEDKPLIAGGMNKLFVLNPVANVIQRYDLRTFEKEMTVPNPVEGGPAETMVMGHACDGPLLVVAGDANRWGGKYGFLDAKTLRPLTLPAKGQAHGMAAVGRGPVRASADGRVYGFWKTGVSPTGLSCLVLNDDGTTTTNYEHTSVGTITPGADGTLFTGGGVYTPQLKPLAAPKGERAWGMTRVPAAHGTFYAEMNLDVTRRAAPPAPRPKGTTPKGTTPKAADPPANPVAILLAGETAQLVTLDKLAGFDVPANWHPATDRNGMTERMFFVPAAKAIAIVNAARTSVFVNVVDLKAKMAASGADYLTVVGKPGGAVRGQTFAYAPEVWSKAAGVTFKLESGPAGMKATAAGVEWTVPKDATLGTVDVILTVSNAAGKEAFHAFKVSVGDP